MVKTNLVSCKSCKNYIAKQCPKDALLISCKRNCDCFNIDNQFDPKIQKCYKNRFFTKKTKEVKNG